MTWSQSLPFIHLDPSSGVPIYRQVMDRVRAYAAAGVIRPGDQLPSIRALAHGLGVNPTTVVKAYTELEHAGLIERRHGRGVFVAKGIAPPPPDAVQGQLLPAARRLVTEGLGLGLTADQLREVLERALADLAAAQAAAGGPADHHEEVDG